MCCLPERPSAAVPVQFCEHSSFEVQILEHCLDNESDVSHGIFQRCVGLYAPGHRVGRRLVNQSLIPQHTQRHGDVVHRPLEGLFGGVGQRDLVPADRETQGDPMAHQPGANNADLSDFFERHRMCSLIEVSAGSGRIAASSPCIV